MYDKRVGLVAGDQSAACLAQVIFGHVGGEVYTEKRIHVSEILTFIPLNLIHKLDVDVVRNVVCLPLPLP